MRVASIVLLTSTLVGQAPVATQRDLAPAGGDWLVTPVARKAGVFVAAGGRELVLANGLVRRTWRIDRGLGCIAFDNLSTGASMLRAVRPEARITVDGKAFDVGGLVGQPNQAFLLPEWGDDLRAPPEAMRFIGYAIGKPQARFPWKRVRHHAPDAAWPPSGVALRLDFEMPPAVDAAPSVRVAVHYELYDGVPVMSKWLTVHNVGAAAVRARPL